ncbi:uncharacterized protein DFR58_11348 [Anaerobacterium chartisolvens]|uniref:Radical SAM core domain-containing protein n=1 Tax=Anaerobacterium chartisolvens TaxID=1297424 RepID=A0A369B4K0_9FIRM|nr:Cys-rich peptide radical SAM maturase CcpM [Anaerobacterium chartisolvens]RCX15467.1 uncharacterized protein DFR58_11348 [Anaerobacterium chartisolvens]
MLKNKPFIHQFKTRDGCYIYDVNTNRILRVRRSVYYMLLEENWSAESQEGEDAATILKMMEDGLLSSNRVQQVIHAESELLPYILNSAVRSITLQVTRQCNLRCNYCVYSGSYLNRKHSNQNMSFDTAKKGIDFLISHSNDSRIINVGFYGGEPMLEFELIKKCILYAEEKAEGKSLSFSITSNGTLLDHASIEFFEEHDVSLLISLDGPVGVHNRNRRFAADGGGTFNRIMEGLEKIKAEFPSYFKKISFNAVLDPQNDFSCTNEFFTSYETIKDSMITSSEINGDYSKEKINISDDYVVKREYEIFKLFLSKVGRLDIKYVSKLVTPYYDQIWAIMHDNRVMTERLADDFHHSGPCIPGAHKLFMDINGKFYPCERVSEISEMMKIGDIENGFDMSKISKLLNIGRLTEDKCKDCWAFRFCTLCASSADDIKGLSAENKLLHCPNVIKTSQESIKDYCTLMEFGCNFEDNMNNY